MKKEQAFNTFCRVIQIGIAVVIFFSWLVPMIFFGVIYFPFWLAEKFSNSPTMPTITHA